MVQPFCRAIGKVENMNYQQHIPLEKLSHMSTRRPIYECLLQHCNCKNLEIVQMSTVVETCTRSPKFTLPSSSVTEQPNFRDVVT